MRPIWSAVDYEPLPVVVDAEAALGDSVVVHAGAGTNVALAFTEEPDPALFDATGTWPRDRDEDREHLLGESSRHGIDPHTTGCVVCLASAKILRPFW